MLADKDAFKHSQGSCLTKLMWEARLKDYKKVWLWVKVTSEQYMTIFSIWENTVLDHVLLNIGPFARCWTPPGLLVLSAILYPRIVRYYKSQRAPRLGTGRPSSDVTVGYIVR
ncbi:hypothetical protein AMECASPLE_023344 [Ameca splendens]|uniref:Uncharacterized protein n=1 Tax=Ameca splendens TaxID=208324 RepID=A0ABV0ZCW9_9TELE